MFDFWKKKKNKEQTSETATEGISFDQLITPTISVVNQEPTIPEFQGDYAKAVFLWACSKRGPIHEEGGYARYITYELGITNPVAYHEQLIREGYFSEDSVSESLESLKTTELKKMAEELGLATSGTKAKLAERIMGAADTDYIYRRCPTTFSITDLGKEFVAQHDDYVQIHRHHWVSWEEYKAYKDSNPSMSFHDIISNILLKQTAADTRFFGRTQYLFLSELENEFGSKQKAAQYLMQVIYLDVSGSNGIDTYNYVREGIFSKASAKEHSYDAIPNGGIVERLIKLKEYIDEFTIDTLYSWRLPVQLCEKELFTEMMLDAKAGTYNQEYYAREMKKRYEAYIDSL